MPYLDLRCNLCLRNFHSDDRIEKINGKPYHSESCADTVRDILLKKARQPKRRRRKNAV